MEVVDNETHYVHPTRGVTLCGEGVGDTWEAAGSEATVAVTCEQCRIQFYWLPAAGEFERGADLAKVIEPWPAGARKHVTGDDDPARGRLHRPESLQLCLLCGEVARAVRWL